MATIQVTVAGLVMLAMYRFLLGTIGVDKIGVWSLVLATTSVTRISELGLSGSVVKFSAKYLALHEEKRAAEVIETAASSVALILGLVLLLLYPALTLLIDYLVPANMLTDAQLVLPYAVMSLWLMVIATVFLSGLDGIQRADLRGLIIVCGQVLYLSMVYALVPSEDMKGLGISHVAQAGFVLLAGWVAIRSKLSWLGMLPYRWSSSAFREMFGYAINFQINGIAQLLFEPTTKALLSKFGGLSSVAYYEMANRMIMQIRSLLVAANQVVVPVVASLLEKDPSRVPAAYRRCYEVMFYLSVPAYSLILLAIPAISELWVGRYEFLFVTFSFILTACWFFNTLASPAYFSYAGIGRLRWNTLSHLLMGACNVLFGYIFATMWGGIGVVSGTACALLVGSVVPIAAFHSEYKLALTDLFPKESRMLTFTSIAASAGSLFVFYNMRETVSWTAVFLMGAGIFSMAVGPLMWQHKTRSFLTDGIWALCMKAPGSN
ncbi:MAG: oligosaccharide flippase family protein [Nitrospirota bacterium]